MALTVPQAGTTAGVSAGDRLSGHAASLQFEADDTGGIIAEFGQAMLKTGNRLEADRLDRQMRRANVDMTKELGDLSRQAKTIADPDELDAFWRAGVAGMRQRYLAGRVDRKIAADWQIGFDDLVNRHAGSLGIMGLATRAADRARSFADLEAVAGAEAASADPAVRERLYADYDAGVDDLVARGMLTPEAAAAKKSDFRASAESAGLTALAAEDPEAVAEEIGAGAFPNVPAEEATQWLKRAQGARGAATAEAANASAARESAADARLRGDLAAASATVGKGRATALERLAEDPAAATRHPEAVARLRGAIALRDAGIFTRQMTPDELVALETRLARSGKVTDRWQAEARASVTATLAATRAALARDPVGWATSAGLPVPALDVTDPEALAEGLADRAAFGDWMAARGYTASAPLVTLDERRQLGALLASTPAASADLASRVVSGFGDRAEAILSGLGVDPVTRTIAVAGGDPALAREAAAGAAALDAGDMAGLDAFLARASSLPDPDRFAVSAALGRAAAPLADAILIAGEDPSAARRVALGQISRTADRDLAGLDEIAGQEGAAFARALSRAGFDDPARRAIERFAPPAVAAAMDPDLPEDEARTLIVGSPLSAAAQRRFRNGGFRAPRPDPAEVLAERIVSDATARRLAEARRFVADSPAAVAAFRDELAGLDALPAKDRPAALAAKVATAQEEARASLGRPLFYGGGAVTPEGLKAAARRIVAAHREGRMDSATYEAQARLIQGLMGTFDG